MGLSPITFSSLDVDFSLSNEREMINWLRTVAKEDSCFIGRLSYSFCSDEHLLEMNKTHLNHDYYTDVITFDESRLPLVNGNVFISIDRVRDNAQTNAENEQIELYRVMAHGLLHLMGYGDKTEEEILQMRSKESQALRLLH